MAIHLIANSNKWYRNEDGVLDTEFIRNHEDLTSLGSKHQPLSSALILEKFHNRADALGLKFNSEVGALQKEGIGRKGVPIKSNRFMYLAEVVDPNRNDDYTLAVGFRNFGDKTLSFSGMCSASILCCENMVCTGIVKPSKMRHTIGNVNNDGFIESKIDHIFKRFIEDSVEVHNQISLMKSTPLTNDILGEFVRKANGTWKGDKFVKNPLIGSTNLCHILEELENPTLNSHNDNSCMRLHNAGTYVTTHIMKNNPNRSAMASRAINNLIMSIIKPDFTPLGDVVDVEVEDDVEVLD